MKTLVTNCITLILFLLISTFSFAQSQPVSGSVSDEFGFPLMGVNILIVGTSTGTQTDENGNFSIKVDDGQLLQFSFVGYSTQEILFHGESQINIVMEEETSILDEIFLIGYGTQSKRYLTDNIVKLTSEDIIEIPTPNVFTTLAGKAAGIQINQTNGKIEGGINFRIRGQTSISAGNNPLFVLDGIPLINRDESNNGRTNPLISLSPSEIESIDILKDASAAAIYGARGANGVVVITTKRGKSGPTKFSINFSNGVSEPANTRDWLNAEQYVELLLESAQRSPFGDLTGFVESTFDFISDGTWQNNTYDTDWQDIALQDGFVRDMDFSMSGGNDNTRFFFTAAYNDTKGIVDGNELDRFSGRINLDHDFSSKLSTGMNLGYSRTNIDRVSHDFNLITPLQAIAQAPISPAFVDGEPFANTYYPNYLLEDKYSFYNTKIRRITGKLFGEYKFMEWLKWRNDFAYDYFRQIENYYGGRLSPFNSGTNGYSFLTNIDTENYILSSYVTLDRTFDEIHDVNIVLGTELNRSDRSFSSVEGTEFPSDDFDNISSAASIIGGGGGQTAYSFVSYFLRATYSLQDKYLFKASLRRDGSSRFGKNNQFGTFPAVSAGWILTEEDFLNETNWLSFLKIRASWGETGNAEIPDFGSLSLFEGSSYNQRPGIQLVNPGNDDLTWETTEQIDIGLEFGLWDNKIRGEIAYYTKNTKDLLFRTPLPLSSGNPNGLGFFKNNGKLSNKGFEFSLNTRNFETDAFSWTSNFNFSINKSEIKELLNGEDVLNSVVLLREGEAPWSHYFIEYAGVDPDNGDALYYLNTENPDGSLNRDTTNDPNEAERIVNGQPFPKWMAGMTNTLTYKSFDLSFTFSGEWGAKIFNDAGRFQEANGDWFDNQTTEQLNRWQNPGDITNIPEARFGGGNGTARSTRYLESGDFVRLRNLTLGYNLPVTLLERTGFTACRIYLSGLNLLTITNYSGYDPESRADLLGGVSGAAGVAFYSAPAARTYSLGVNISF